MPGSLLLGVVDPQEGRLPKSTFLTLVMVVWILTRNNKISVLVSSPVVDYVLANLGH